MEGLVSTGPTPSRLMVYIDRDKFPKYFQINHIAVGFLHFGSLRFKFVILGGYFRDTLWVFESF